MLMSATIPSRGLSVGFGLAQLFQDGQALHPSLLSDVLNPGRVLSLSGPLPDATIFFVQGFLVFLVIMLDDSDLLMGERGNPAADLVVGRTFLKIGHQVLHGDSAGR